jgi:carboxymethylenebutenolidase
MQTTIQRPDGSEFGGYLARPYDPADGAANTPARGAVVVLQEIFGVNAHIRAVADRFAEAGYLALAPALFDRVEPAVELTYTPEAAQRGRTIKNAIAPRDSLDDIACAIAALRKIDPTPLPVAAVGYCWGGLLAWQAAAHLDGLSAAVAYYGGGIPDTAADLMPKVPVMLHFGRQDTAIPLAAVEALMQARPEIPIHLYDAGHGFNCDQRASFAPNCAKLAHARTLAFLVSHLRP